MTGQRGQGADARGRAEIVQRRAAATDGYALAEDGLVYFLVAAA